MKVLVNASTLVVGGGVQVAINFIKHTLQSTSNDYYYILSERVYLQIHKVIPENKVTLIKVSPAKMIKGIKSKKTIKAIEKKYNPDIVYSIGAPSYVNFKTKEVLRLTNPLVIGGTKIAFTTYPFAKKIKEYISLNIKRLFIKREHYIITQTNAAKQNIHKNLKVKKESIFVIPNVHSSIFNLINKKNADNKIRILTFSAPYLHKNLDIIPSIISELRDKGCDNFKFNVTISPEINLEVYNKFNSLVKKYKVEKYIDNVGKVDFKRAPELYAQSDILFLPTLLEVFSVTYLEAMATKTPIVTTNLPFAKEVCQNAALYFEPKNSSDAANKLFNLMQDKEERERLKENGIERLKCFENEKEIYTKHIETLEKIFLK